MNGLFKLWIIFNILISAIGIVGENRNEEELGFWQRASVLILAPTIIIFEALDL